MKKGLAITLVLVIVMSVVVLAFAETKADDIDFSGMSFEELMAAQEKLTMALWESKGWQSVEVPVGVYLVGRDIPAGTWTLTRADESDAYYAIYKTRKANGDLKDSISSAIVKDKDVNIMVENGMWIAIKVNRVKFTTATGLGFIFR